MHASSISLLVLCSLGFSYTPVYAAPAAQTAHQDTSAEARLNRLDSEVRKLWVQRKVNKQDIRALQKEIQKERARIDALKKESDGSAERLHAAEKHMAGKIAALERRIAEIKLPANLLTKEEAEARLKEVRSGVLAEVKSSTAKTAEEAGKTAKEVAALTENLRKLIAEKDRDIRALQESLEGLKAQKAVPAAPAPAAAAPAPAEPAKTDLTWVFIGLIALLAAGEACAFTAISRVRRSQREAEEKLSALAVETGKKGEQDARIAESLAENTQALTGAIEKLLQSASAAAPGDEVELIKLIADRMTFMQMTLYRMDKTVRGYKQLSKALSQMKDNLAAHGYELVDYLGKPYNDGMKATVSFVEDESLEPGTQVITGVVRPQINHGGVMIQSAQLIVSQNIE
jgi:hypothetical protein